MAHGPGPCAGGHPNPGSSIAFAGEASSASTAVGSAQAGFEPPGWDEDEDMDSASNQQCMFA